MAANISHTISRPRSKSSNVFRLHNELFIASFTRQHNPSYACRLVIADKRHPLYHRSMNRFLALPRDMLWVHISTNSLPFIAVQRTTCRRQIESVLYEALKDAKFDLNAILWGGKRVEMMKRRNQHSKVALRGVLTGTLDIVGQKGLRHADRGQIKEHISFMVEKLKNAGQEKSVKTELLHPKRAKIGNQSVLRRAPSGEV